MDVCMKENGKITKSMGKVFFPGKMEENMKVPTSTTKDKDKVNISGLMERSTLGSSKTT